MARHGSKALEHLASCLRGQIPADVDWLSVISLANESLTAGNLALACLGDKSPPVIPEDVAQFLTAVLGRNRARNARLRSQVAELGESLQARGLQAVFLKGTALILQQSDERAAARMISDADLLVAPSDKSAAVAVLREIGYVITEAAAGPTSAVTLARQSDVGMIDLHVRVRGPSAIAQNDMILARSCTVDCDGVEFRVPSPSDQIAHLVLHDQFHNRDYWKGAIDLRHLCDLDWIISNLEIDWQSLELRFEGRSELDALASQLLQAHRLLGTEIPRSLSSRWMARMQVKRCIAQLDYPVLAAPFAVLTIAAAPFHRNRDAVRYDLPLRERSLGKWRALRKFFTAGTVGKL